MVEEVKEGANEMTDLSNNLLSAVQERQKKIEKDIKTQQFMNRMKGLNLTKSITEN